VEHLTTGFSQPSALMEPTSEFDVTDLEPTRSSTTLDLPLTLLLLTVRQIYGILFWQHWTRTGPSIRWPFSFSLYSVGRQSSMFYESS